MNKIFYLAIGATLLLSACKKADESIAVSSVKVITMPLEDNGSAWDWNSDADVFFRIKSETASLYRHATTMDNVDASKLPLTFDLPAPYTLPSGNQLYKIALYDYDGTSADDFIGEVSFNPNDLGVGQSSMIVSGNALKVEIAFVYQ